MNWWWEIWGKEPEDTETVLIMKVPDAVSMDREEMEEIKADLIHRGFTDVEIRHVWRRQK